MSSRHPFLIPLVWGTLVFGSAPRVLAQAAASPHTANPERPTVATNAGTVAPGWFEIESGVERDRLGPGASSIATPTLLKFGVARRMQFDIALTTVRPPAARPWGIGDDAVALKWRLADGMPLLGDFAVQPSIKLPTGSRPRGTGTGTTDYSLVVISSHALGPTALDLNLGYTRHSDGTNAALWTVSTGTTIAGPLALAAEIFGYPGFGAGPSVGFLSGPTWTVHPWFVADAGFIANVSGLQPPALYAGLTWNVGRWR